MNREVAAERLTLEDLVQLGEQRRADHDLVPALQPEAHQVGRRARRVDQRRDEDVEVQDRPHAVVDRSSAAGAPAGAGETNLFDRERHRRFVVERIRVGGPSLRQIIEHTDAAQPEPPPQRFVDQLVLRHAVARRSAAQHVEDVLIDRHRQLLAHTSSVRPLPPRDG